MAPPGGIRPDESGGSLLWFLVFTRAREACLYLREAGVELRQCVSKRAYVVTHSLNRCLLGVRPRQHSTESLQSALILTDVPEHRLDLCHEIKAVRLKQLLLLECETHVGH